MTITLEFDRDPDELRDMSYDPLTADASDLQRMLLRQNVRLTIGGQTVLEGHISLMLMCFGALDLLKNLESDSEELEIPEGSLRLEFKRRGASVTVHETYFDKVGTTGYEDLLAAWRKFAVEARDYLLEEFPGLADHPEVGPWFREDL